jgi:hypothetical protein
MKEIKVKLYKDGAEFLDDMEVKKGLNKEQFSNWCYYKWQYEDIVNFKNKFYVIVNTDHLNEMQLVEISKKYDRFDDNDAYKEWYKEWCKIS